MSRREKGTPCERRCLRRQRLAGIHPAVFAAMILFSFGLCAVGVCLFMISAAGETFSEFQISQKAAAVHGINGLAVDKAGNIYEGTDSGSSIQVFDCNGKFLYRYCIPTYKAVSASFYWALDERGQLVVYTYRDYDKLTIENQSITETVHFNSQEEFETAVEDAGFALHTDSELVCIFNEQLYEASFFGKVFVSPLNAPNHVSSVELEVPHFPPPVFVSWGIGAIGLLSVFF